MITISDFISSLFKKNKATNLSKEEQHRQSKLLAANDFLNVSDIRDSFLYGKNDSVFVFLQIEPVALNLLSVSEKELRIKQFSSEFSGETKPFKFFSTSRPVDVSTVTSYLYKLTKDTANSIQKRLLADEISAMTNFAIGGQSVERLFYMILWEPMQADVEHELLSRAQILQYKFLRCGTEARLCNKSDIVRLCNLFLNPNSAFLENDNIAFSIPVLVGNPSR